MSPVVAGAFSLLLGLSSEEAAAKTAASSWLAIVDAGRYEESWEEASVAFRENMARFGKSREFWVKALGAARTPLGKTLSRSVSRVAETDAMPGGPEGRKYLELVYESRFTNAEAVTETVVVTLDDDGLWRVFNYLVRRP